MIACVSLEFVAVAVGHLLVGAAVGVGVFVVVACAVAVGERRLAQARRLLREQESTPLGRERIGL